MNTSRNRLALKLAFRNYYKQLQTDWRIALPALMLPAIGSTLVFYVVPLIVAKMLARFSQHTPLSLSDFSRYIWLFVGLWALGELLWRIAMYFLARLEVRGMDRLYVSGFDSLLKRDLAFFHNEFGGSLTKKIISYGRRYETIMDTMTFNIVPQIIPMMFGLVILWLISAWLALTLILFITLALCIILPLIRRRQSLVAARETANNVMSGHIADAITNIDAVKAYAKEDYELDIHAQLVKDFLHKTLKTWDYHNQKINVWISPFYVIVNAVGLVLAIWLSTKTHAKPEVLFITFSYYTTASRIVWNFHEIYRTVEIALSEAAQFTELLLDPPRLLDSAQPQPFKPTSSMIEFKNVNFRYHDSGSDKLFKKLNLAIADGEKVALAGHSGGGKTTITRLLLRFMDVDSGEIVIGGQNIALAAQSELRDYIAYVPQEPVMFHRSLADNIAYGHPDAPSNKINQAAKMAYAAEFIEKLPDGYGTLVGERGVKLSGGQRQRIAIARAMLKNAPVLILDEATSSLDSESERYIQAALWKLMEGRTAIVIAHRLSTIQRMDRIVVLEDGRIVEQGNHRQLLEKGGVYARLWAHQSGGFLDG